MDMLINRFQAAFSHLPAGVRQAELHCEHTSESTVTWDGTQLTTAVSCEKAALYLRTAGERSGNIYTEDLDCDPYELMRRLLDGIEYAECVQAGPMNGKASLRSGMESVPLGGRELIAYAKTIHGEAVKYSPKISCSLTQSGKTSRVVNSLGLDSLLCNSLYLIELDFDMPEGGKVKFSESFPKLDIRQIISRLTAEIEFVRSGMPSLPLIRLESGKYDAVMSSMMLCQIMMTAWQSFSGEKIHRGASSIRKVGEQVGSSVLSIINSPTSQLTGFDFSIDCEGTPCESRTIIRDGFLEIPLLDLSSAGAFGLPPTGSAGRSDVIRGSISTRILPIPAHIYVKPGVVSVETLIGIMGDGIYLTYSLDGFHTISIASGMFSIPCGGVLYKGGKPVARVEQITIAGDLKSLFRSIEACGSDLHLQSFMYKNFCYGGPSLLLRGLNFAG